MTGVQTCALPISSHASALTDTTAPIESLDALAAEVPSHALDAMLRWIAAESTARTVAADIERAATRIYELVAAVKQFTYMDQLSDPRPVDVEADLRSTLRILAAKAMAKEASITVQARPGRTEFTVSLPAEVPAA